MKSHNTLPSLTLLLSYNNTNFHLLDNILALSSRYSYLYTYAHLQTVTYHGFMLG